MIAIPELFPSPENARAFADLLHTLKGAIAFVGAGVSVEAGYPTWSQLMERLHEKVVEVEAKVSPRELEQIGRMTDLLWRAEEYRRLLDRTAFNATMWDIFRPRPAKERGRSTRTAQAIAKLGFRHYITTNYDSVLESACGQGKSPGEMAVIDWTQAKELQEFLRNVHQAKCHFLYLHGQFKEPDQIILSERDYSRRYAASDDTPRKLFTLFATQRLVFLGFSLSDPDLMFVLRSVNAAFAALEPQHFVVAPLVPGEDEGVLRRKFVGKHGVQPVFFCAGKANPYAPLPEFLEKIATLPTLESAPARDEMVDELLKRRSSVKTKTRRPRYDPDDPLKGTGGGTSTRRGVTLSGTVSSTDDPDWFSIRLVVKGRDKKIKLGRFVRFRLHPTFTPDVEKIPVENGEAIWEGYAVGAFTSVAETETGVKVELDLSEVPNAPRRFRER